jgi:serine protease Do
MTRLFHHTNFLITLIISALISSTFNAFCTEEESRPSAQRLTPAVRAVKKALPWVVNIGTRQEIIQINDPFNMFFTEFFGRARGVTKTMQYSPLGSGVIVDAHGLILTNSHVVRRAPQIEVRLWDGSAYPAKVVGYDMPNDLCLLQLDGDFADKALVAADFARCNDLLLGESVIAIGNPFGLEHSVSQGVLSAFNRSFTEDDVSFDDILQTDAAINPGNSGGPLVNLDGQLIGINLAIRADAQGICFAIPLARIEQFLSYWLKPSHFASGYLGLAPNTALQRATNGGVILPEIADDSPLAKAGLHEGDVITAVDGDRVTRPIEMSRLLWRMKADQKVTFTDDKGQNYNIIVAKMPQELLFETRLGLHVQALTPQVRRAMGVSDDVAGVMVSEVLPEPFFAIQNARWRQIIKRGDIIVQFNDHKIDSAETLAALLAECRSGDLCQLGVYSIAPDRRQYIPVIFEALYLH